MTTLSGTAPSVVLGDLNARYVLGRVNLTSVTSYTHRDILVVRDAGALTSSITGGSIGRDFRPSSREIAPSGWKIPRVRHCQMPRGD